MTQEEARKFLMNKKVFVKDKSKEIQLKLFELGFSWGRHSTNPTYLDKPFIYIWDDGTLCYGSNVNLFYNNSYKEISAEDILNIKAGHLPKTWEEFCENNPVSDKEACIAYDGHIITANSRPRSSVNDENTLPSYEAAKAHRALMQLHQLRDCYRGNADPALCCYSIMGGGYGPIIVRDASRFLSFPTKEIAKEFASNFKDLIEQAGDLI